MYLPSFGQDLESKKKVFGILAHVWYTHACTLSPVSGKAGHIVLKFGVWLGTPARYARVTSGAHLDVRTCAPIFI